MFRVQSMKARALLCLACMALLFTAIGCRKKSVVTEPLPPETGINAVVETQPHKLVAVTRNINASTPGYYVALPSLYDQTTKRYPAILFFTGGGQLGNGSTDLPLLANDGMMQLVVNKTFPPNIVSGDRNFSFVVFNPQFSKQPTAEELLDVYDFLKKNYRVDTTRIYMSGLSFGALLADETAALIPSKFGALVTMSNAISDAAMSAKCAKMVAASLPVWAFHNKDDQNIPSAFTVTFINTLRSYRPKIDPRLTLFASAEHDAWTPAINPAYRENNMNIYEFMLKYHR